MSKKTAHHRVSVRTQDNIAAIRSETATAVQEIQHRTGDSYVNFEARVGYRAGNQSDAGRFQIDFISRNPRNLEAAYRSNWLCGMAIDIVAEDMTRAGVTFTGDDLQPGDIELIDKEYERLNLWGVMSDNLKWGRLYGGSIMVHLIDGQNLSTPLRPETVGLGQYKGAIALDRWQVMPSLENLVTDYGPDLGKPKYYTVNTSAEALIGEKIHYSRVWRIDGTRLPWQQRITENGWGQSILERLFDRIIAFDSTTAGAAQLVYKAHLRTLKIENFRKLIAEGGKMLDAMIQGVDMMRRFQTNEGLSILDKNDEFDTHSYTFAGLDKLLEMFGEQLSGGMQIPLVRLFGQSPGGIGNDGESALHTYYDNVVKEQDQKIRPGLNLTNELIARSVLGREMPAKSAFSFNSLREIEPLDKAKIVKDKTDAIVAAEGAALISPAAAAKELRAMSRETGVYGHITDEDIAGMDDAPPEPAEDPALLLAKAKTAVGIPATSGQPALAAVK